MARKLKCGCIPDASGYGYCDECTKALREKIWRNLTPQQRSYDTKADPMGSRQLIKATGITSHPDHVADFNERHRYNPEDI